MHMAYKGDDFERAFRPYHIETHVSSQLEHQPQTFACRSPFFGREMLVVVVTASQSAASLEPDLRQR